MENAHRTIYTSIQKSLFPVPYQVSYGDCLILFARSIPPPLKGELEED